MLGLFTTCRASRRRSKLVRAAEIQSLESRQLQTIGIAPAIDGVSRTITGNSEEAPPDWDVQTETRASSPQVPAYSSLPSARAKLYLDFDGHVQNNWGSYRQILTPVFDVDGDESSFNDTEKAMMEAIWAQVSEDFAPFNLDVTTVKPSSLRDREGMRISIGGRSFVGRAGGIALIGSFTDSNPNTAFVFPKNLSDSPKYIGEAVSHEAGHAFSLYHQSRFDDQGREIEEYHSGDSFTQRAPIMGNSYYRQRGVWWSGPTFTSSTRQDDLAVLSNRNNGFGYRADDHGDTPATATQFSTTSTQLAQGIISQVTDRDVFRFEAIAGTVTINLNVPRENNLHAKISLQDSSGRVLAEVDPPGINQFNATISTQVPAGTYFVTVASHGEYGDLGQYSLTGSYAAPLNAPTLLTATAVSSTRVNLSWRDQSSAESGFVIERSTNAGQSWSPLATTGANATSFPDLSVTANRTYHYRVRARNASQESANSNVASATTPRVMPPLAPTGLSSSNVTSRSVRLSWADQSNNEERFVIQRQVGNGNWVEIGTTRANTTSFTDSTVRNLGTVKYRVRAANSVGDSAWSNVITVRVPTA